MVKRRPPEGPPDIEGLVAEALAAEFELLQSVLHRTLALGDEITSLEAGVKTLSALALTLGRTAALLDVQRDLSGPGGDLSEAITRVLDEFNEQYAQDNGGPAR